MQTGKAEEKRHHAAYDSTRSHKKIPRQNMVLTREYGEGRFRDKQCVYCWAGVYSGISQESI